MQLIVKEDKLQKYRDHVQNGLDLTGKDKEMFDRFFFAFTNLLDGLSERKVVELLMFCPAPLGQLGQSQAYNIVNGAQEIFGALDFGNTKKVAQRYIYATRLEEMSETIKELARSMIEKSTKKTLDENGNEQYVCGIEAEKEAGVLLEKSANVLMKAAKIKSLLDKDKVESPNKFVVAPNIIFTDDMAALDLIKEINDIEFEDVTGNGAETEEGETETTGSES